MATVCPIGNQQKSKTTKTKRETTENIQSTKIAIKYHLQVTSGPFRKTIKHFFSYTGP